MKWVKILFFQTDSSTQKLSKPHFFTDEQIRNRAYQLWLLRGKESSSEENWHDAIQELTREQQLKRVLRPIRRFWSWTGLRQPTQSIWKWTGFQDKRGWDFLQLLIAPFLIAGIGWIFQNYSKQKDINQQKADKDRELLIADNKAKQDTLIKYFDQMEELLKNGLLNAKIKSDKFILAQTKTVITLQSLDRKRQQLVIQFLEASGFNNSSYKTDPEYPSKWDKTDRILLYGAKMRKANLVNSDLSGFVLVGTDLSAANLGCAGEGLCSDLSYSDLRGANLQDAILTGAYLRHTYFTKGANLRNTVLKDADIKYAHFEGAKHLTKNQVISAKNWNEAHYDPDFRNQLDSFSKQQKDIPQNFKDNVGTRKMIDKPFREVVK